MHVILFIGRHIVVDDKLDAVDVNATGHDIRRHQDGELLLTKREHHFFAFRLLQIAGHSAALDAGLPQRPHNLAHRPFP